MGNDSSYISNESYSATEAIAEAYLSITQDIAQGLSATQVLNLQCGHTAKQCTNCIKWWKKYFDNRPEYKNPEKDIAESCAPICECKIEDVKMDQQIFINFEAFTKTDVSKEFLTQVFNSINQQAQYKGGGVFEVGDRVTNTTETVNKIYNAMRTDTFQSIIQGLQTIQTVSLVGGGKIINVDMNSAVKYMSHVLTTSQETSSLIDELQTNIIQLSSKVADAGLTQLITWLVRLVMLIFIIILLLYTVSLIFQIYALYV